MLQLNHIKNGLNMSHDKIATRLVLILVKLNNGERFTVEELSSEFNVTVRTIQRDLNERLSFIPIIKENNHYFMESYALGKLNFKDIKNFAVISGIKSLYPMLDDGFISDILNIKLNNAYLIKNQGFENISHQQDWFNKISAAIIKSSPIEFTYKEKKRVVNPYKLINNQGVWYLLADENEQLKSFTFSKIKQFSWSNESKVFTPKKEFLDKISQNDTNWFSQELIEVVLEINNTAKEYFFRKDTLPNKQILEQKENHFIVSTKVSYDDEILRVVKYWMPYIKIVSPVYLKKKFNNILEDYLKTTQPCNEECNSS